MSTFHNWSLYQMYELTCVRLFRWQCRVKSKAAAVYRPRCWAASVATCRWKVAASRLMRSHLQQRPVAVVVSQTAPHLLADWSVLDLQRLSTTDHHHHLEALCHLHAPGTVVDFSPWSTGWKTRRRKVRPTARTEICLQSVCKRRSNTLQTVRHSGSSHSWNAT